MKLKIIILPLCLMWLSTLKLLAAQRNCECGTHATGIYAYTVDGTNCCEGVPGASAQIHHYI